MLFDNRPILSPPPAIVVLGGDFTGEACIYLTNKQNVPFTLTPTVGPFYLDTDKRYILPDTDRKFVANILPSHRKNDQLP